MKKKLPLVDQCILLFLLQLLLTLTLTIFYTSDNSADYSSLDVVFRTSIANIFGYILSSNFMNTSTKATACSVETETTSTCVSEQSTVQIIVTTTLGMFCIFILTCVRFQSLLLPGLTISNESISTLSQFRDFISGCTGFLIGIPKDK
ncbi:MAG: hypothetical protein R3Y47_10655 [Lachnospiraceae bacterium]